MYSFIFTVEPAGGNGNSQANTRPLTPIPSASSSSKSANDNGSPSGESGTTHVRPPSPVLPRRKSAGQALRTTSCPTAGGTAQSLTLSSASGRRISLNNRRGSGYVDEKEAHRKKSLTWSENDVNNGGNSSSSSKSRQSSSEKGQEKPLLTAGGSDRKRKQSRKSFDNTVVETTVER